MATSCKNSECLRVYSYMLVLLGKLRVVCLSQMRLFPVFHLNVCHGDNVMYF